MIELTRLNNSQIMINCDLIETVEENPDTVITLTTGKKFVVKESRQDIRDLVISYKQQIIKFE
ncbi:MAG: flagellar FlbD family protein [Alistipes sp.]|nr:flagellar FlbD family protein [Alistipes sp.]